jgi:hypothetical protein
MHVDKLQEWRIGVHERSNASLDLIWRCDSKANQRSTWSLGLTA